MSSSVLGSEVPILLHLKLWRCGVLETVDRTPPPQVGKGGTRSIRDFPSDGLALPSGPPLLKGEALGCSAGPALGASNLGRTSIIVTTGQGNGTL